MKNTISTPKQATKKRILSQPPLDLDPSVDISWDNLMTSDKHTSFPIYGSGEGHIRKGKATNLGEVIFMGSDAVNRPIQVIYKNRS